MAKIIGYGEIKGEVTLVLSESEAKALDALVGYGPQNFLRVFYEKLGKAYLEPHERGLRSLFESVRNGEGSVSNFLKRVHDARDVFTGKKNAYAPPVYSESIEERADSTSLQKWDKEKC
jgi:hypothetical protein